MAKKNLVETINDLKKAKRKAITKEKTFIADLLLALRRKGRLAEGKWTDPELATILESLDTLASLVTAPTTNRVLKEVRSRGFHDEASEKKRPQKIVNGKSTSKSKERRAGNGIGATSDDEI